MGDYKKTAVSAFQNPSRNSYNATWRAFHKMSGSTLFFLALCTVFLVGDVTCQDSLTENQKKELLNTHNKLRGEVVPPASNMEIMVSPDSSKPAGWKVAKSVFVSCFENKQTGVERWFGRNSSKPCWSVCVSPQWRETLSAVRGHLHICWGEPVRWQSQSHQLRSGSSSLVRWSSGFRVWHKSM